MGREERVQKILAAAGVASRRASEDLIAQGRVTVDGVLAELGMKADAETADIRVDGERINANPERVYVLLNKPRGFVTTADDPEGRPTVFDLVNLDQRLFPVGRLDMDTEGLLLLTNDGDLAHALMHPSYEVPRVYVALVQGSIRRNVLHALREGVELEDGFARPLSADLVGEEGDKALIEVVMAEGRKREVRRLLGAVGLRVERLARVAYGGVELGELRQGKWRFLTQREIGRLFAAVEDKPIRRQNDTSTKRDQDPRRATRGERRARGGPRGTDRGKREHR